MADAYHDVVGVVGVVGVVDVGETAQVYSL